MKITTHRAGDVSILTLNRPESLNAICGETILELNRALDEHEADDCVALVLTGTGRAFCAGADLKEQYVDPQQRVADMHALVLRLASFSKITVAAINGLAFGGGLELAMGCTFRISAPTALLGLPEARLLKAMPGYGGTQLLPRLVGKAIALEMLLTGDPISAERAERIGLVNSISTDCVAAAIDLARRSSVGGVLVTGLIRTIVEEGVRKDLATALDLEAAAVGKVSSSPETLAAMAAFAGR